MVPLCGLSCCGFVDGLHKLTKMVVLMLRHANGDVDLDGAAKLGWDWRLGTAVWMGTRSSIGI
ncbi:hypothetical protein CASFOL_022584 [Castilleja foliolosa]|uniref:Uncharacterized protein n=1 Tax=Castilleja foliolosa TaxID=1961234 RepID=A0ABD3CVX7_9LAMI